MKTAATWAAGVVVGYLVGRRFGHQWIGALGGAIAGSFAARKLFGDPAATDLKATVK